MSSLLFRILFLVSLFVFQTIVYGQIPSFPGAEGFGGYATGGRGGRVIYVTNLNTSGPGSLQAALEETGKRYILFKVSGVINGTVEVPVGHGDFTFAGQTSPAGIIVRGFQSYNDERASSGNFIIRHLKSRIGSILKYPSTAWIAEDGITLGGVHNAIIDHCSFGHVSDEAVDISRSSALTIQHCILAETLGSHYDLGGMLINYSASASRLDSLSIHHNVWQRIGGRMPEISCESSFCKEKTINLELSNNLFWDPKIELWYEGPTPDNGNFYLRMNAVNNYSYAQSNFGNAMFHFDLLNFNKNQLYFSGNQLNLYPQYADYHLFYCCNDFNINHPNANLGIANRAISRFPFPTINYHTVTELRDYISKYSGSFPRDNMDHRLMNAVSTGIFDTKTQFEDHYGDTFTLNALKSAPADSDNDGMPDYWESAMGLNKNIEDHNNLNLSQSVTGKTGYSNLECYLNCLSDALVNGFSKPECNIDLNINTSAISSLNSHQIYLHPNLVHSGQCMQISFFKKPECALVVYNINGNIVGEVTITDQNIAELCTSGLKSGLYFISSGTQNSFQPVKFIVQD